MPSAVAPVAASPGEVGKQVYATTVSSVDVHLQWCRAAIDYIETLMADSSPTDRTHIRAHLNALAEKVKCGEYAQALSEVSLEARKGEGGPWVII